MIKPSATVPPTVYVIDDETPIQLSLKALLKTWRVAVVAFSSARAFWDSYQDEWTGCVLVDLRMPGESGLTLLKELQERRGSLTAILMTGHGDIESQRQAIQLGAISVLEKPFRANELKELLERHCPEILYGTKSTTAL